MGAQKIVTIICDLPTCKAGQGKPLVVEWNETLVEQGKIELPELARYLVILVHNNVQKTFCCQLHAAEYFLPPGYEATQKQVIQLPSKRSHHKKLVPKTDWKDEPLRSENSPLAGQDQADGFGPEAE